MKGGPFCAGLERRQFPPLSTVGETGARPAGGLKPLYQGKKPLSQTKK